MSATHRALQGTVRERAPATKYILPSPNSKMIKWKTDRWFFTGRKGEVGVSIGEGQQDDDLVGQKLALSESVSSLLHLLDAGIG